MSIFNELRSIAPLLHGLFSFQRNSKNHIYKCEGIKQDRYRRLLKEQWSSLSNVLIFNRIDNTKTLEQYGLLHGAVHGWLFIQ